MGVKRPRRRSSAVHPLTQEADDWDDVDSPPRKRQARKSLSKLTKAEVCCRCLTATCVGEVHDYWNYSLKRNSMLRRRDSKMHKSCNRSTRKNLRYFKRSCLNERRRLLRCGKSSPISRHNIRP